jgi:hypothetical protein
MSTLRNFHVETALGLRKVQALAPTFSDPAYNSRFQFSVEGKVSGFELLMKKNKTVQTLNQLQIFRNNFEIIQVDQGTHL